MNQEFIISEANRLLFEENLTAEETIPRLVALGAEPEFATHVAGELIRQFRAQRRRRGRKMSCTASCGFWEVPCRLRLMSATFSGCHRFWRVPPFGSCPDGLNPSGYAAGQSIPARRPAGLRLGEERQHQPVGFGLSLKSANPSPSRVKFCFTVVAGTAPRCAVP